MKSLIIAEKPTLGRTIASALGCSSRQNGYLEGDNYIITWCFGHLYTLKNVTEYEDFKNIPWESLALPFFPDFFELKEVPGKEDDPEGIKKQIQIIQSLIFREDVKKIIHCGDADREGQIIVDEVLEQLENKKPVYRLWLPEQTPETIKKQVKECKLNTEYKNLHHEGIARSRMDWALGINLSTYLLQKTKVNLRVGRVLIPIVKFIYDRDIAIQNFQSEKYYQLESKTEKSGIGIPLIFKKEKFKTLSAAEELAKQWNTQKGKVTSITKKEVKNYPKKLFSLNSLQKELSKKHKMSFERSMIIIQKLYEEGYITYPRTNTEYLAENEKERVQDLLKIIQEVDKDYILEFKDSKKVFDSSKIESHSALTPTYKLPEILSKEEETVYQLIFNRFISNFLKEETILSETSVNIEVGEESFVLKGTEIVQPGFYRYEPKKFDNQLPNLIEGEEFEVNFLAIEKETEPPKKVTESDLSSYLENPFRKELKEGEEERGEDSEDYKMLLEGLEIGTVATRTESIKKTKRYGYITQENSTFQITELGEKLIHALEELEINLYKEKTVEFSKILKRIYNGECHIEDGMTETWKTLYDIINKNLPCSISFLESVGACPVCGKDVYERRNSFVCEDKDCSFIMYKLSKHFKSKFTINLEQAKKFLNQEYVECALIDEDKKTRKRKMKIVLNGYDREYVNYEEEKVKKESVGACPVCGKDVYEGKFGFYCSGYKEGCTFQLSAASKYFSNPLKITKATAKKLLKKDGKASFEIEGKDGNKKKVDLRIKINGKWTNFEEVK